MLWRIFTKVGRAINNLFLLKKKYFDKLVLKSILNLFLKNLFILIHHFYPLKIK